MLLIIKELIPLWLEVFKLLNGFRISAFENIYLYAYSSGDYSCDNSLAYTEIKIHFVPVLQSRGLSSHLKVLKTYSN